VMLRVAPLCSGSENDAPTRSTERQVCVAAVECPQDERLTRANSSLSPATRALVHPLAQAFAISDAGAPLSVFDLAAGSGV
jgi:hypothetical protein